MLKLMLLAHLGQPLFPLALVRHFLRRYVVMQQDVGHLETTARTQNTERLGQHGGLIGAQVEDTVGDHHVHSVAISVDGSRIVSGHGDTGIRLWEAATGKMIRRVGRMTDTVWSVQFSPDGKHVASASSLANKMGEIKVWERATGKEVHRLLGHAAPVFAVAFAASGEIVRFCRCRADPRVGIT